MVALQTGLVELSHRQASKLKVIAEDKKKEVYHYKKKISSLKKSFDASEDQAHKQEIRD